MKPESATSLEPAFLTSSDTDVDARAVIWVYAIIVSSIAVALYCLSAL